MGCCQDKDCNTGWRAQEAELEEVGEGGNTDTPGVPREWEGGRWGHTPGDPGNGRGGRPGRGRGEGRAALSCLVTPADAGGTDVDSPSPHNRRSNESLLITVLWRRLSLFSRRGSKRQSFQSQKRGSSPGVIQEEPEKG